MIWYDEGTDITQEYKDYFYRSCSPPSCLLLLTRLVQLPLLLVDLAVGVGLAVAATALIVVLLNWLRLVGRRR